jgi:glycosyltransferase involved in cell wall biosynthesis
MPARRAAPRAVLHDLLRLFLGAADHTPRGIDRIDLAYARFLCTSWPGPCLGVLPTPLGPRLFDRARVLRGLDALERLWQEDTEPAADPVFAHVQARLAGQAVPPPPAPPRHALTAVPRVCRLLAATGVAAGQGVAAAPRGAVYLNVGQLGWAAPFTTRWLARRPDIRPVFMLHDAIPVERRDLVSGLGHWTHRMMLQAVARRAAGLIVTTGAAAASVRAALAARGLAPVPTVGIGLPVAPAFLGPPAPGPPLPPAPYFLVCGAIEPRKNLLMLLDVWQALRDRHGAAAPVLVVAGALARGGAPIQARLAAAGPHVVAAARLSTPGLRRLMEGARALLMPSLAEGFGLPIVEALALGTPVLASDLPAHREAGGSFVTYLDPADRPAWTAAIAALAGDGAALAAARRQAAAYRPFTEEAYFARAGAFLADLA